MDPHTLPEVSLSLGCRLARFHPVSGRPPEERLEIACHVGLVTFLTTFSMRRRFLVNKGIIGGTALSEVNADPIRGAAKVIKIVAVDIELSLWATHVLGRGHMRRA